MRKKGVLQTALLLIVSTFAYVIRAFDLPCRCNTSLTHVRNEKFSCPPSCLALLSSSSPGSASPSICWRTFFGPPEPHGNREGNVFGKKSGSFESTSSSALSICCSAPPRSVLDT